MGLNYHNCLENLLIAFVYLGVYVLFCDCLEKKVFDSEACEKCYTDGRKYSNM